MAHKGISPLIAAVLLIAFTMAVAGLAGPFLTEISKDAQESTEQQQDDLLSATDSQLDIERTQYNSSHYTLTVRNSGHTTLNNYTITVQQDSPKQKQIDQKLEPGDVTTFDIKGDNNAEKILLESTEVNIRTENNLDNVEQTSTESGDGGSSETSSTTVEDFNDDVSGWDQGGNLFTTEAEVQEGSSSGLVESTKTSTVYPVANSLANYPSRGDTIQLYMRVESGTIGFLYGVQESTYQDESDGGAIKGYSVELKPETGFVHQQLIDNENDEKQTDTSATVNTGTWYLVEIDWGDPTHTAKLMSADGQTTHSTISIDETDWSSGNIALKFGGANDPYQTYIDDIKIIS